METGGDPGLGGPPFRLLEVSNSRSLKPAEACWVLKHELHLEFQCLVSFGRVRFQMLCTPSDGVGCRAVATGIDDIIVNSVALGFLLQLDEIITDAMLSDEADGRFPIAVVFGRRDVDVACLHSLGIFGQYAFLM